jgi:hypothetical protein
VRSCFVKRFPKTVSYSTKNPLHQHSQTHPRLWFLAARQVLMNLHGSMLLGCGNNELFSKALN